MYYRYSIHASETLLTPRQRRRVKKNPLSRPFTRIQSIKININEIY